MKVGLKWLSKFVDLNDYTPNELADILSKAGTEIEGIHKLAQGTNLCIGEIVDCANHPSSDHLHLCKVNIGNQILQIVCGAPNCRKGLKVIVALEGAKLPINGGTIINKGHIRGVESQGMLCSLLELGVEEKFLTDYQKKGIEELPSDAKVGNKNVLEYLELDDTIFEFKTLPNRGDTLSIISLAIETAACLGKSANIRFLLGELNFIKCLFKENISNDYEIKSQTSNCKLFLLREINGIAVTESPNWIKNLLRSAGIRSVNNIVDIGNYVMLLTGQPIHMYDADKLPSKQFIIRDDLEEKVIALDNKEYNVEIDDILITIGDKIGCIGGIMGSLDTSIDSNTKNIVIETAIFDGIQIRKSSNRLQLQSDSSQRYIRGIDKKRTYLAADLATSIIAEQFIDAQISNLEIYDEYLELKKSILINEKMVNKLLGTEFTLTDLRDVFTLLYFKVEDENDHLVVTPASYRLDINVWQDLAEEVIRIKGFDFIKEKIPASYSLGEYSEKQYKKKLIRNFLVDNGLVETLNYTLYSSKNCDDFNIFNHNPTLKLLKPITEDRAYLRSSLIPSLLNTINYNQNRKASELAIFEVANIYQNDYENLRLGIILTPLFKLLKWKKENNNDFYTLKGLIEALMRLLGIDENRYSYEKIEDNNKFYHPGRSAYLLIGKKKIGIIGQIHPLMEKKYDVSSCFVAELNLDEILQIKSSKIKLETPSIYPFVSRDIALVVNEEVNVSEIIKVIRKNGKGLVSNVEIFDIYRGNNLENGKKSVAITIIYQDKDKTLNDNELLPVHNNILFALQKELMAFLRK